MPPIQIPTCRKFHFTVRFRLRMEVESEKTGSDGKVWRLCSMPFWQTNHVSSSSSTSSMHSVQQQSQILESPPDRSTHQPSSSSTVSSVAKSLLPTRRRLRLDPPNKLYFPCMQTLNNLVYFWSVHVFFFCIIFGLEFLSDMDM